MSPQKSPVSVPRQATYDIYTPSTQTNVMYVIHYVEYATSVTYVICVIYVNYYVVHVRHVNFLKLQFLFNAISKHVMYAR